MKIFNKWLETFLLILNNERGELSLTGGDAGSGEGDGAGGSGGDPDVGDGGSDGGESSGGSGAGDVGEQDWTASLPEGLDDTFKQDPSLKVFVDKEGQFNTANLIKSYVNAQKKIGEKGVFIPGKEAGEEDWKEFYSKLRDPDLEKYEIKANLGDDAVLDKDLFEGFRKTAHENGLTPQQAEKVLNWYNEKTNEMVKGQQGKMEEAYNAEVESLKKDWGESLNENLELSKRALKEFADEKDVAYLKETGLDKNPRLIRLFNKIGKSLVEEGTFDQKAHGSFGKTAEEAQVEINRIMGDMSGPYWNGDHASHKDVVEQVQKLQEIVHRA